MTGPSHSARALPAFPSLEQQKKQARELLDAARAHDSDALRRLREHHPRFDGATEDELRRADLALHDAQLVLAREYGFPSWPKLKATIEARRAARHTRPFVRELEYYDGRAEGLAAAVADGVPIAIEQVRAWHPRLGSATDEEIQVAVRTLDDARLVTARQHGFSDWPHFTEHLHRLAAGKITEPFMEVYEAGKKRDMPRVETILRAHPDLARARGTSGNTLLNLAASLSSQGAHCTPPHRRLPAALRLAPIRLLLELGADVNEPNDRGGTPLHQAAYTNDPEMAASLIEAGARVDVEAHGSGGTPLAMALFWGHREVAEVLAGAGVLPANLRLAAGVGRVDLVERCFDADGALTSAARGSRGFYRPHSGFPAWQPSDDPQEVLDEALVWAAKSGRTEVMPVLVQHGARVNADPYRGTPLTWAADTGRIDAMRWLLDQGADVNARGTFGGPGHGNAITALHIAAQNDRVEAIELLLSRGADASVTDALYKATPEGWAEHEGSERARAVLRAWAERTRT